MAEDILITSEVKICLWVESFEWESKVISQNRDLLYVTASFIPNSIKPE
jgi:hypothetical protein